MAMIVVSSKALRMVRSISKCVYCVANIISKTALEMQI